MCRLGGGCGHDWRDLFWVFIEINNAITILNSYFILNNDNNSNLKILIIIIIGRTYG